MSLLTYLCRFSPLEERELGVTSLLSARATSVSKNEPKGMAKSFT